MKKPCPNCKEVWPKGLAFERSSGKAGWRCKSCGNWYYQEEIETPDEIRKRNRIAADLTNRMLGL